jgi:hypothetical protein
MICTFKTHAILHIMKKKSALKIFGKFLFARDINFDTFLKMTLIRSSTIHSITHHFVILAQSVHYSVILTYSEHHFAIMTHTVHHSVYWHTLYTVCQYNRMMYPLCKGNILKYRGCQYNIMMYAVCRTEWCTVHVTIKKLCMECVS